MEKLVRAMLTWDDAKLVLRNQKGQGMVEYGLILALIAVVTITALTLTGTNLTALFDAAAKKIVVAP
jgi:pilus assembly protein Flp/PilA